MKVLIPLFFVAFFMLFIGSAEPQAQNADLGAPIKLEARSLFAEFKRFINFNFDLSQQQFRYSVPEGWIADDSMYSKRQNRNFIGEYNEGYFEYQVHPAMTREPSISFEFWDSKIARAGAIILRRSQSNNDDLITIGNAIKDLLSEKYGNPENAGDQLEIDQIWKINGKKLRLQAHRGDPNNRFSAAHLSVELTNEVLHKKMKEQRCPVSFIGRPSTVAAARAHRALARPV